MQKQAKGPSSKYQRELRQLFLRAGLSGTGLDKLCRRHPPPDLRRVQAVLLYAEANGLGPGYIYRHLESEAAVEEPFLEFAALDEATLELFREAIREMKANGTLAPVIRTPISQSRVALFTRFARAFADLEPAEVRAALARGAAASESRSGPHLERPSGQTAPEPSGNGDLKLFWDQLLKLLETQMTQATFEAWVKDTRLIARDDLSFTVIVNNRFARDWLEHRLLTTIRRAIATLVAKGRALEEIKIDFVVRNQDHPPSKN